MEEKYIIIMIRSKIRDIKVTSGISRDEILIISEMKNTLNGIHSRLNTVEEKINEFEGTDIQIRTEIKKIKKNNMTIHWRPVR